MGQYNLFNKDKEFIEANVHFKVKLLVIGTILLTLSSTLGCVFGNILTSFFNF